jgi:hypothetical protein
MLTHFTANTHQWDRDKEDLQAIAHTHPNGTSFSGADLAAQVTSRARAEYVRTGDRIIAILRTGAFETALMRRLEDCGGDATILQAFITETYDTAFAKAVEEYLEATPQGPDEEEDVYLAKVEQHATRMATMAYARFMQAGYYEGPTDGSEPLTRRA